MIGAGPHMDSDERELLARTLDGAVAAAATSTTPVEALDIALVELGWHQALAEDTRTAIWLLFDLQGRHGVTSCALDAVMALGLRGGAAPQDEADRAEGADRAGADGAEVEAGVDAAVAVLLPTIGSDLGAPPGRVVGSALEARGKGTVAMRRAPTTWVACLADDRSPSCAVVATSGLDLHPVRGIDPDLGLVDVSIDALVDTELLGAELLDMGGSWSEATRLARLALSHELVGTSRTMVRLARDHAVDRIQFGKPIAQFQAVRHRLAEAFVAVEAAEAAIEAAWDDGGVLAASVAKAVAGRSAQITARHAQQVLAGIGFTTEHPLHRFVRRSLVLDGLLGDARSLQRCIGEELLASGHLPPLVAL